MQLWRLTASELAARVRARELSAREIALDALARLASVNPAIGAVVDYRPEEVVARADAVDARVGSGDDAGPLAGVPVTTKVNIDQQGYATTNGVTLQKDVVAGANNPAVDNLLRAGAVLLGRTNVPAFSYRWFTDNRLYGATRNPWDPRRTPGGSSGGAAAAVAAGIGALALGTDIAGSIRYPAYACGVMGIRPTPGRVPSYNGSLPDPTIGRQITAVAGPIARTVGDVRLALRALAAPDGRDPWWTPAPLIGPAVPLRAAMCVRPDGLATRPEIVAAVTDCAARLRAAGWSVDEVDALPPLREAAEIQTRVWFGDNYARSRETAEKEGDEGALAVLRFHEATARSVDAQAYAGLFVRRLALMRAWNAFLERTPVVLMPVSGELPFLDGLDRIGDAEFARIWEAQMTQLALPILGLPGMTITTSLVERVPVGVQIVAGRFREDLCLAAAEAIEAAGVPPTPIDPAR